MKFVSLFAWLVCGSIASAAVPVLVDVPAGRYDIGMQVTSGTAGGNKEDQPDINNYYDLGAYGIGKYEVSNAEFCDVMNWGLAKKRLRLTEAGVSFGEVVVLDTRSNYCRIKPSGDTLSVVDDYGNHPVTEVTWYGAMVYCALLNERENLPQAVDLTRWTIDVSIPGFRLPSEVEWEVAALGGKSPGYNAVPRRPDAPIRGQLMDNVPEGTYHTPTLSLRPKGTAPCGSLPAHGFGTHDMVGNVWEWCADQYLRDGTLYYAIDRESWDSKGKKKGQDWTLRPGIGVPNSPVFDAVHLPDLEKSKLLQFAQLTDMLDQTKRVTRGKSWTIGGAYTIGACEAFFRRNDFPERSTNDLGFRVARSGHGGSSPRISAVR